MLSESESRVTTSVFQQHMKRLLPSVVVSEFQKKSGRNYYLRVPIGINHIIGKEQSLSFGLNRDRFYLGYIIRYIYNYFKGPRLTPIYTYNQLKPDINLRKDVQRYHQYKQNFVHLTVVCQFINYAVICIIIQTVVQPKIGY